MIGDVLDLVGDRPGVGLDQARQRVGERLTGDVETQDRRGNARLELRREPRDEPLGLECGIAGRLGAERVEMRGEVAVHAVRLHESHGGRDSAEELVGDRLRGRRGGCGLRRRRRMPVADRLEQAGETRMRRYDVALAALEQPAPLSWDRVRILEVLLEQVSREAGVQPVDVGHYYLCSSGGRYQRGWLVTTATAMPTAKETAPTATATVARRSLRPPIPIAISARRIPNGMSRSGRYATPVRQTKIETAARNPAMVSAGRLRPYGVTLTR